MMMNDMLDFDMANENMCGVCGCTDDDCLDCYMRTGTPCYWLADDLCSACGTVTTEDGRYVQRASGLFVPN